MLKKNKKSVEMSFTVIFSIIAGAFIIFIATYAAIKIAGFGQKTVESEAAKQIANILNPVVNGITSASATKFDLAKETRIYLNCKTTSTKSYFGRQDIAVAEKSGFLKKWISAGENITRYNKFIFGENMQQGKDIFIFSKPFYSGYRVDDLVFLTMGNYCFVSAPDEVEEEIISLGLQNVNVSSSINYCSKDSFKACFGFSGAGCNASIYGDCKTGCKSEYDYGRVVKNGKTVNYYESLIYAAIFSSPEIYECNIERLGRKIAELGKVYKGKIDIVKKEDCSSIIGGYIDQLISISTKLVSSKLKSIYEKSVLMDKDNCDSNCPIYTGKGCFF